MCITWSQDGYWGSPGGSVVKNPPANAGDLGKNISPFDPFGICSVRILAPAHPPTSRAAVSPPLSAGPSGAALSCRRSWSAQGLGSASDSRVLFLEAVCLGGVIQRSPGHSRFSM